ncbi:hypothetical protein Malapachy_0031 [Malassezia pachydermatis]|uniref:Uncharacterized protein n=1 Tax=Malassezia pachydermatis TaxID=77020 RepID=A0A0M9VNL7_9BASI|nr:hypothetical protein Malapachy_0031 [Malassezia pachydermatis]KOS13499.1 hypothetical protein Malapachy_0031 [Malassezia pachydermatis]
MGQAKSKPARQAGAAASSAASARAPAASTPLPKASRAAPPPGQGSSFEKSQAILDDARDPQFLRNLDAIGPLQVKTRTVPVQGSSTMLNIMQVRAQQEPDDTDKRTVTPGLSASEAVRLLCEYQDHPTEATLERLAVEYDVDKATLSRVVKHVRASEEQPLV